MRRHWPGDERGDALFAREAPVKTGQGLADYESLPQGQLYLRNNCKRRLSNVRSDYQHYHRDDTGRTIREAHSNS